LRPQPEPQSAGHKNRALLDMSPFPSIGLAPPGAEADISGGLLGGRLAEEPDEAEEAPEAGVVPERREAGAHSDAIHLTLNTTKHRDTFEFAIVHLNDSSLMPLFFLPFCFLLVNSYCCVSIELIALLLQLAAAAGPRPPPRFPKLARTLHASVPSS